MSAAELDALARSEFEREAVMLALAGAEIHLGLLQTVLPRSAVEAWIFVASEAVQRLKTAQRDVMMLGAADVGWRFLRLPGGVTITLTMPYRDREPMFSAAGSSLDAATMGRSWSRLRPWRIRRAVQIIRAATKLLEQPWVRSCERIDGKWCCHACRGGGPGFASYNPPKQVYRVPNCPNCLAKILRPLGVLSLAR